MGARGRHRWLLAAAALAAALAGCGSGGGQGASDDSLVIGVLRAVQSPEPEALDPFLDELAGSGFSEGKNLRLLAEDPTEVHADPADAKATVARWASQGVDLVLALSTSGAMAAAEAAPGTDILFLSNDPTASGLVKDERRPDGHLTGMTFRVPADRTLDLVRRAIPGVGTIGLLSPASDPAAAPIRQAMVQAADSLGVRLVSATFEDPDGIGAAIESLRAQGATCLVLANSPTTVRNGPAIGSALTPAPLPVVANTASDLAVLVLEPDTDALYRQMGRQAVRLLRGTPVSDVPVEDPARFRVVVNAGAASRLGIELAPDVVRSADRVLAR